MNAGDKRPKWVKCDVEDCIGAALRGQTTCIAHTPFDRVAHALALNGGRVDARGVRIDDQLLLRIVAALPRLGGKSEFADARFDSATFLTPVKLAGVRFAGRASFSRATFKGDMRFARAEFLDRPSFRLAAFDGNLRISARFPRGALFEEMRVAGQFSLSGRFGGDVSLHNAALESDWTSDEVDGTADLKVSGIDVSGETRVRGKWKSIRGVVSPNGRPTTFRGPVNLAVETIRSVELPEVEFSSSVRITSTVAAHDLDIAGATFHGSLEIGASTMRKLDCSGARFNSFVAFTNVTVTATATFRLASFNNASRFRWLSVEGESEWKATYAGDVLLDECYLGGFAAFARAEFQDFLTVKGCKFGADAQFDYARFSRQTKMLPADVEGTLSMKGTVFEEDSVIEASGCRVALDTAVFAAPVTLQLPDCQIGARRTRFHSGSSLAGLAEHEAVILTLQGANVPGLRLAVCDLTRCALAGTHGLDELHLGEAVRFASSPGWPRWSRRAVIAEERRWRAQKHRRSAWRRNLEGLDLEPAGHGDEPLGPKDIASLYRALRKAKEDGKDAPGAGDMFYGEMEMRREATSWMGSPAMLAERGTLSAYWATAGYALRAWRALLVWLLVVAAGAVGFATFGFVDLDQPFQTATASPPPAGSSALTSAPLPQRPPPDRFPRSLSEVRDAVSEGAALQVAIESALPLPALSQPDLDDAGRAIRLVLRVVGPVLLALALLSLRGRVRR